MSYDWKLQWHPNFGAVVCMDADSELSLEEVLRECPFVSDSPKVCHVGKRRSWFSRMLTWLFG